MFQYWPDSHPTTRSWNYQLYRLVAETPYGGADFGEIHRAAVRMRPGISEDWYTEWRALAERVAGLAATASEDGRPETARAHFLRAFSYYRSAEFYLPFNDDRRGEVYGKARNAFKSASQAFDVPVEPIHVPFDGIQMEGYWFPPERQAHPPPWPTVFFLSGVDAYPEENYFRGVTFFTRRGVACVCVNGPGQGSTIRLEGRPSQFDYEKPVGAVLDYLVARSDVDATRIGLLGESMGGYYGARAAALDARIKATVLCGALYDVLEDFYDVYPPIKEQLEWVIGAQHEIEAREMLASFNLRGVLRRLDRPLLVVHGEADSLVPVRSAYRTYEEAVGPKELRIYRSDEGGSVHGQMDARATNIPFMVDWLVHELNSFHRL